MPENGTLLLDSADEDVVAAAAVEDKLFFEDSHKDTEPALPLPPSPLPVQIPDRTLANGLSTSTKTTKQKLTVRRDGLKTLFYQCRGCPYQTSNNVRFQRHLTLHEDGTKSAPCEICGWYLREGGIRRHHAQAHMRSRPPKPDGPPKADAPDVTSKEEVVQVPVAAPISEKKKKKREKQPGGKFYHQCGT